MVAVFGHWILLGSLLLSLAVEGVVKKKLSPPPPPEVVERLLRDLYHSHREPTTEDYSLIKATCQSRQEWSLCLDAYDYFRQVLMNRRFAAKSERIAYNKRLYLNERTSSRDEDIFTSVSIGGISKKGSSVATLTALSEKGDAETFGDDACTAGKSFLVVSDGISSDADSRYFSQTVAGLVGEGLARIAHPKSRSPISPDRTHDDLKSLMESVQEFMVRGGMPAAATLSFALLQGGDLWVATLGDSEVMVLREGEEWIYRSPQQRAGATPGQLNAHNTRAASETTIKRIAHVRHGDLIVMASDGLWDNVLSGEVRRIFGSKVSLRKRAEVLVEMARRRRGERFQSVRGEGRKVGGRIDDITVLVAEI